MITCIPIFIKTTKNNDGRLYLRIIHKRRKIKIPLKISLSEKEWNKGDVIGNKKELISSVANKAMARAYKLASRCTETNILQYIRDNLDKTQPSNNILLKDFLLQKFEENKPRYKPGTLRQHPYMLKRFYEYNTGAYLSDFNRDMIVKYDLYLRSLGLSKYFTFI